MKVFNSLSDIQSKDESTQKYTNYPNPNDFEYINIFIENYALNLCLILIMNKFKTYL
jgi:hypothetical protein